VGPFQVGVVAVGAHDSTGGAPLRLTLLHPCPEAMESSRAGGVERDIYIFWIEWSRTGGRCEDKDGRAGGDIFGLASHELQNIFDSSGWYKQLIPKINFRYRLSLTADTKNKRSFFCIDYSYQPIQKIESRCYNKSFF
jgi:hypothetical protein